MKNKNIFGGGNYNLSALIISVFSLLVFLKTIEGVVNKELITKIDIIINSRVSLFWNSLLTKLMIIITNIGSTLSLLILSVVLFCFFIYKKKNQESLLLLFSMLGGLFLKTIIKIIIARPRPINMLVGAHGNSFPSGHATMSTIFFSLLIYLFKDKIKNKITRIVFILSNITIFLLIGISRIYLSVHWFSDVIAGFSLGLFWITFSVLIFEFIDNRLKKNTKKEISD